jgi:RNA polymerase sigma-70 factor (ECF subfamily)
MLTKDSFTLEQYQRVHRHLLGRTRSASLADDLAQETMVQAMRFAESFAHRGAIEHWLLTIANNLFRRHLEREKRRRLHIQRRFMEMPFRFHEDNAVELGDAIEDLRAELRALPRPLRQSLEASVLQERSYPEAAALLGITLATLRMRVFRAKRILEKRLSKHRNLF